MVSKTVSKKGGSKNSAYKGCPELGSINGVWGVPLKLSQKAKLSMAC